uniref:Peptidase M1 leukotriene A4 hydrolase/aminopeptidase C-terminal domain-containing protein n=1 Tax=Pyxicephalus adspersus TaxID=30357 RepID=A0AAV3BB00_PYXAD|nr:TPA: hypothetical protein GDO54_001410 [Pyxicephalus adspersus]
MSGGRLVEDAATASSYRDFQVEHFHLELQVDTQARKLSGSEKLDLRVLRDSKELRLDSYESLTINRVWEELGAGERRELPWQHQPFTSYGTVTAITMPELVPAGTELHITIEYEVGNNPGVCWLEPEQTAGKKKPYMYTQGQAVLNRCFFPCFDTPAVKSTYSANIKVPEGFTAIMSANNWDRNGDTFIFQMTQPIPSYLVALVVGDIVSAEVGPRSRVWAEPCLIEAAKKEYDGVIEEFLTVGEKLFGPYVWGRYDVLFMPPSFPFGGMENPCITFVTPCLLAGDRSLADVIIHEISHSWFGNLVTNANWGDFWLNEGFTMYAQRRITTKIYGVNPDDTYNETPYEKGFCFVSYLDHLTGDQSKFDAFLRAYVDKFKFQSITADEALAFYLDFFPELKAKNVDKIKGLEFTHWLDTPGWPAFLPDLSPGNSLMKPADELAELWSSSPLNMDAIGKVDISSWKTYQIVYFLDQVLQKSPLPPGNVEELGKYYSKISEATNAELRLRWAQIVLKNDYQDHFPKVRDFLVSQGKQKYTLPLYRAMKAGSEAAHALATETFHHTSPQLHHNVRNYVKKILAM